jgi:hypothetical protein
MSPLSLELPQHKHIVRVEQIRAFDHVRVVGLLAQRYNALHSCRFRQAVLVVAWAHVDYIEGLYFARFDSWLKVLHEAQRWVQCEAPLLEPGRSGVKEVERFGSALCRL